MKRVKKFDDGGLASSEPQFAFGQPRGSLMNVGPQQQPQPPVDMSMQPQEEPAMKKGGLVKGWGKARGGRKAKIR